jgi:Transposase, Mutator family
VHDQDEVKADFWAVLDVGEAEPGDEAIAVAHHQAAAFAAKWQARYPAAVACVSDDLASLTVHLRFPAGHWPRIGHSNLIERTFGETRRRTKVIGRLPGEATCLALVWAVLDRASRGWRGLTMTPRGFGCSRIYAASSSTRPCQRRWSTRPSPLPRNIPRSLRPEPLTPLLGRHPRLRQAGLRRSTPATHHARALRPLGSQEQERWSRRQEARRAGRGFEPAVWLPEAASQQASRCAADSDEHVGTAK